MVIAWAVLSIAGHTHAIDFNGDRIDDMVFRDRLGGDQRVVVAQGVLHDADGGPRQRIPLDGNATRGHGFDVRTGDFDGDGQTDVLDRDLVNGAIRIRLMDGADVRASGPVSGPPRSASVAIKAVADFDADGRDDLLLRNSATGIWSIWLLSGLNTRLAVSGPMAWAIDGWEFAGVADFDGNGTADLLLHRADAPGWRMIRLDGRESIEHAMLDFLPPEPRWQLEAIADINRDGRADLLLRDRSSGAWHASLLAGSSQLPDSGTVSISDGRIWRLQLFEDLNGDGSPDALLARDDSGEWRIDYLLERRRLAGSGIVDLLPDTAARIADAGDYDGDGVREVLVSYPKGWRTLDLRNAAQPRGKWLDMPRPRAWTEACAPPQYHQYLPSTRPAGLDMDIAFLSWRAPSTRTNGEALCPSELSSFELRYGKFDGSSVFTTQIRSPNADSRQVSDLSTGSWWFRLFAVDSQGNRSEDPATGVKTVR